MSDNVLPLATVIQERDPVSPDTRETISALLALRGAHLLEQWVIALNEVVIGAGSGGLVRIDGEKLLHLRCLAASMTVPMAWAAEAAMPAPRKDEETRGMAVQAMVKQGRSILVLKSKELGNGR